MTRHIYHAWHAIAVTAIVLCGTVNAAPQANDSPANEPKAIVEALIGRDFRDMSRYTGGHEGFEYKPIFESYPPYDIEKLKVPRGSTTTREATPTFGKCTQKMLVKNIKITKVQYAKDPASPANQPRDLSDEVYVTVEAEVLALQLFNLDKIPADRRCSWLGLEVKNTQTGKREAYFDNADDGDALLKMMKQFGTVQYSYRVIDPHRRQWSYGISLILPKSGKGLRRHYDREQRKYVDAVEPRWLIQDPFPPQAVHVDTAIARLTKDIAHARNMALAYCRDAIKSEQGVQSKSPDFNHPACEGDPKVYGELAWVNRLNEDLKVLRQIK